MDALTQRSYRSPFKINLGLEVLAKRPDGYHEINTVLYRFDEPHDTLHVNPQDGFSFTTNDPDLPHDERNLVVRALKLCAEYAGAELPKFSIHLEKVIPHGAGLGGGSANAATAIHIYSDLAQSLPLASQIEIAGKLGADVPFFLHEAKAMKASGIGNVLEPLDFTLEYPCVIVKPRQLATSTTESYAGLKVSGRKSATDLAAIVLNEPPSRWTGKITNDFEHLAFQRYPQLESIRGKFLQFNAIFTLMSGSGGASYGIFDSILAAEEALIAFRDLYRDGFCVIAR